MIKIIVAIFLLPVFVFALGLFPWPDIPVPILNGLTTAFKYLFALDPYIPVKLMTSYFFIIIGIEVALRGVKLFTNILGWVTGHKPAFGDKFASDNEDHIWRVD